MYDIKISKTNNSKIGNVDWDKLGFGKYFSDHMFVSEYSNGKWSIGDILPYGPIPTEPGMCTLHYGQTIFEGLKAFHAADGGINIFRPEKNAKRLNHSGSLLCMPPFEVDHFLDALSKLIQVDKDWVPKTRGHSLYIRPLLYGDGNFLGVHSSDTFKLIIMTSPVASYYPEGMAPVKILVENEYVRAVKGGLGAAKTAANYAASLYAGENAKKQGYAQVLWLDGVNRHFVDEVGAMNMMFVINDELITPPLDSGTILRGVTRESVLELAQDFGIKHVEKRITIDEVFEAHKTGKLQEAFGTGTAAVISPVGHLHYDGDTIIINDMKIGPVAQKFYDTITGIQYGEIEDTKGWIFKVKI